MLMPVQFEHQRRLAADADQEQAHAVLRRAKVGTVDHIGRDHVAQRVHGLRPGGVQRPDCEPFYVLYQHHFRPVELGGRHDGPGCRSGRSECALPFFLPRAFE